MHNVPTGQVLPFDKLSDELKQTVLDNNRDYDTSDEYWFEHPIDQAKEALKLLGAEVDNIYFSAGYCQSDGCWLDGLSYQYAPKAAKAIKKHYGKCDYTNELISYAERLQAIQKPHFYQIEARITQRERGATSADVYHAEDQYRDMGDTEDDIKQVFSEFAHDILQGLYRELEYLQSDEHLAEVLADHEFDEDGDMV